jgi:hypothetical protein
MLKARRIFRSKMASFCFLSIVGAMLATVVVTAHMYAACECSGDEAVWEPGGTTTAYCDEDCLITSGCTSAQWSGSGPSCGYAETGAKNCDDTNTKSNQAIMRIEQGTTACAIVNNVCVETGSSTCTSGNPTPSTARICTLSN